jgi:hypothetical protein
MAMCTAKPLGRRWMTRRTVGLGVLSQQTVISALGFG